MIKATLFLFVLSAFSANIFASGKETVVSERQIERSAVRNVRQATGSPDVAPETTPIPSQSQPLPPQTPPGTTNPAQSNQTTTATQNSTTTTTTTTTTAPAQATGGDSNNSDKTKDDGSDEADSLIDFIVNKITGASNNNSSSQSGTSTTPTTQTPTPTGTDCNPQLDLAPLCPGLPKDALDYFANDLSLGNLLGQLFYPSEMEALDRSMCPDGDWCVSPEHRKVLESEFTGFYSETPYCQPEMTECLSALMAKQAACDGLMQYRLLTFLRDSQTMLCDMGFREALVGDCFASTMELLLVSLHVQIGPDDVVKQHQEDLKSENCENKYLLAMNKMYLCACEDCKAGQVDALSSFPEWTNFTNRAVSISQKCQQQITCDSQVQDGSVDGDQTSLDNDGYASEGYPDVDQYPNEQYPEGQYPDGQYQYPTETEEEYLEDEKKEAEEFIEYIQEVEDAYNAEMDGVNEGADAEDRPLLLYGMLALTVIVVMTFVVVAIVSYRRMRRDSYFRFSRGYSQLDQDEETKMLAHAFN